MTVLIFHICIALISVVYTTYLAVSPGKSKFTAAYGLVGLTVVSGTYLVISTHSPLLQSCVTGLVYLAIAGAGIVAAYYRLATQKTDI
jgi:hypothetical protein